MENNLNLIQTYQNRLPEKEIQHRVWKVKIVYFYVHQISIVTLH